MMIARALCLLVATSIIASCGGGGGSYGPPPPPPGTIRPTTGNNLPGPRPVARPQTYVNFESGQVRPLAVSLDGTKLFATNTPDGRLEIYSIGPVLMHLASVPVGLEPVAIAEDPAGRVWVVNHLSDSISIVEVNATPPHVVQTLWVGDEPEYAERAMTIAGHFIHGFELNNISPCDPDALDVTKDSLFEPPGIWVSLPAGLARGDQNPSRKN